MTQKAWYTVSILVVVALMGVALFFSLPIKQKTELGLDLQGGIQVVLQATPSKKGEVITREKLDQAKFVLEERVNGLGVSESSVEVLQNNQFLVQLPGVKDPDRALEIIGQTAKLEFAIVKPGQDVKVDELIALREAGETTRPDGSPVKMTPAEKTQLLGPVQLTGESLSEAFASFDTQSNQPIVNFNLKSAGAKKFGQVTAQNINKRLAIVLDDQFVSAPTIQSQITNSGQITGVGDLQEAKDIALVLDAGALPVQLVPQTNQIVGPTLGAESLQQALYAAAAGFAIVLIYFILFYRAFGLLGWVSLGVFTVLIWGLLQAVGVVMTLPGLAGAILMIGIAADSSIIIFERIKDEMRAGKSMRTSMETGFTHGFQTFLDADLVTFVTAAILFYFGVSTVKGFALVLMLGIVVDLVSSFLFKRSALGLLSRVRWVRQPWLLGIRGLPKKDQGEAA